MTAKSFIKKLKIALSKKGIELYYSDGSIKHPEQIVSELCNNSVTLKPIDWDNVKSNPLPPINLDVCTKVLPPVNWEDTNPLPPRSYECLTCPMYDICRGEIEGMPVECFKR